MAGDFLLSGEFQELQGFIDKIERAEEALALASREMCDEALLLISEGFQSETDPYGKRWAQLKLRDGRILQKSGGLATSWHRKQCDKTGFRIASGKDYAKYHQEGTGIYGPTGQRILPKTKKALAFKGRKGTLVVASVAGVPKRKMIPDNGELPARWRRRMMAAARGAFERHMSP